MLTKELQKKQDDLEAYLKELGSVMLAFSAAWIPHTLYMKLIKSSATKPWLSR